MITVKLFAQFRELLGPELKLPQSINTTAELKAKIREAHPALADSDMLVALNQEICTQESNVKIDDEIAVFPPVTGG